MTARILPTCHSPPAIENFMKPLHRIASPDYLMVIATAILLGSCGESTTSPPSPLTQAAVKLSPEQELAALTKKAEQGNASAQLNLGRMYAIGEGVPKDASKALEWNQKAAAQGDASAQFNLGLMYNYGKGVPKDLVMAYAWLNIAAVSGNELVPEYRRLIESSLSANQVAEAQRLSSNWKKGQLLAREGKPATTSEGTSSTPGPLTKKGTGTLFVVSKAGHAITNQHVASGCAEIRIQGREGVAKLVTEDTVNDLALVQIQGAVSDIAAIAAEPNKLRQGEDIVAYGFARTPSS
jgi:S1-C subfamily serine protease